MVGEEAGQRELRKGEGAADVGRQALREVVVRLGEKGLFGRVLDAVDGELETQAGEGRVRLDGVEGAAERVRVCVGGEAFDDRVGC